MTSASWVSGMRSPLGALTEAFEAESAPRRGELTHDAERALASKLSVSAPSGERIPLTQLAEVIKTEGLAQILREGNLRRVGIKWNIRDRDMGSLVAEAMAKVNAAVKLPEGYQMVWSGRFEDQQRALARLYVIVRS